MVDRTVEIRPHIQHKVDCGNEKLHLNESEWKQAISLRDMLFYAYKCTKKLQEENLSPGYFYHKLNNLKIHYNTHGSQLGQAISESMAKREDKLLGVDCLLAAVVTDVKYIQDFSDNTDHEERGREAVVKLNLCLEGLIDVELKVDAGFNFNSSVDNESDYDSEPELARSCKAYNKSKEVRSLKDSDKESLPETEVSSANNQEELEDIDRMQQSSQPTEKWD